MSKADKRERQRENRERAREERDRLIKRDKRLRALRGLLLVLVPVAIVFVVIALTRDDGSSKSTAPVGCTDKKPATTGAKNTTQKAPPLTIDPKKSYTALVETTCGPVTIALDAANAPQTVNSFVALAKQGFYDGLTFHRVAKDFVVQGGDPKGDGTGGPGYTVPTEPPKSGYAKGSVAMANSGPGTTGSQFFFVLSDKGAKGLGGPPYLYSSLGNVTAGMNVVDKLGSLYNKDQNPSDPATQKTSRPLYIFKVTITES